MTPNPVLPKILLFTQPGCLSCEIMRIFLEAKGLPFEERDMELDAAARLELLEVYHSRTAPTLVILAPSGAEVIEGFDPDRLDLLLSAA
jgi:glutaredoxin